MKSLTEELKNLQTSPTGLSSAEARIRFESQGPNEFQPQHLRSRLWELLRPLFNPLNLILLSAALASFFVREIADSILIAVMVILSSALNFWQTYRSEKAAAKLKEQIANKATVLRDGIEVELPIRELVVGDVVRLSAGDLIPADLRLIEADDLHVQQSALTGESLPAEKQPSDEGNDKSADSPSLLFLGTSVISGWGKAVIIARGQDTAFGEILERLSESPDETEFERGMNHFGVLILKTVFFLVLFVLAVNIYAGREALQSLLFSVALAVSLTPEFLPMITTVTLAQGAVRMARKKVIVKHLSSIQNLGSIDILCSDKTGTLTTGTMSLDSSLDPKGSSSDEPLRLAQLNSRFETGIKSPFDTAILKAKSFNLTGFEKTDEVPFDFNRRRLSIVVKKDNTYTLITKGAPESILAVCKDADDSVYKSIAEKGMRMLAVATKELSSPVGKIEDESDMTLAGFLVFYDHPLEGVGESIEALKRDGVEVKILTGDSEKVTATICQQVGINPGTIVLGSEIEHLDENALGNLASETTVFARVSPTQKERIISSLRKRGHVVGYMGDGINDAPSLHSADVGISVAGAVDIAREASDIILLEHRLSVLHSGIMAGRRSFGNVFKYLLMGTSSNFGNMFSMAAAAIFLPFLPMLPMQILLNSFLYDLAQVTIPTDNIDPAYTRKPQRWDIGLIRRFMIFVGPMSSLFDFLTFYILLKVFGFNEELFHTGWFVESLATQTLVLFVIRTVDRPWTNRPSWPLTLTIFAVLAIAVALPYSPLASTLGFAPLPGKFYVFLAIVIVTYLVIVEAVKRRLLRDG